jgi:hypothetical protein
MYPARYLISKIQVFCHQTVFLWKEISVTAKEECWNFGREIEAKSVQCSEVHLFLDQIMLHLQDSYRP